MQGLAAWKLFHLALPPPTFPIHQIGGGKDLMPTKISFCLHQISNKHIQILFWKIFSQNFFNMHQFLASLKSNLKKGIAYTNHFPKT